METFFGEIHSEKRTKQLRGVQKSGKERKVQTTNKIAINKIEPYLKNLKMRNYYIRILSLSDQIRYMNMIMLAYVIIYMDENDNDITSENFSYEKIDKYINVVLLNIGTKKNEISDDDYQIIKLRTAATFLRYIRYMRELIKNVGEDVEEIIENTQEMIGPSIDEL